MKNDPSITTAPTRSSSALVKSVFALIALIVFIGSAGFNKSHASTSTPVAASGPQSAQVLAKAKAPAKVKRSTPVYGHSVIPGGVRESSELTSALARDRVVRDHYADFDASKAYVVHVKDPRSVHVSYRMGNKIYWTKKKVRLVTGEALLTDGTSFIRARCGNRIAEMPQLMVSDREPAPEVLDTVFASSDGVVNYATHSTSNAGSSSAPVNGSLNIAAPNDAIFGSTMQGQSPVLAPQVGQAIVSRTPSLAAPALVPTALEQVKAVAPSLAAVNNIAVLPVVVTAPLAELPLPGVSSPAPIVPAIVTSPIPSPAPTPSPSPIPEIVILEPIPAAFPTPISTAPVVPIVTLPDHTPTKVPEPGSFALAFLALFLLGSMRPRNRHK